MIYKKTKIISAVCVVLFLVTVFTVPVFAQDLAGHVGSGIPGAEDGSFEQSSFHFPRSVSVGNDGKIYVADTYNNLIRVLDKTEVRTYAGICDEKDNYGYYLGGYVDGILSESRFNKPTRILFDSKGNMYILDTGNHVIRKISGGKVYTFAGAGNPGYKDGTAGKAMFNNPLGMAIDDLDNIYVADTLNNVIRKIDPDGNVTTAAGVFSETGDFKDADVNKARFNEPSSIVIDEKNDIYIADTGNQLIRKISENKVETYAGSVDNTKNTDPETGYVTGGLLNGSGNLALFNFPKDIALDTKGNIFVADSLNQSIRVILKDGEVVTFAIGFEHPAGVMIDNDLLYIVDMYKNLISMISVDPDDITGIPDNLQLIDRLGITKRQSTTTAYLDTSRIDFANSRPVADEKDIFIPLTATLKAWGADVAEDPYTHNVLVKKGNFARLITLEGDNTVLFNESVMISSETLENIIGFKTEWFPEYNVLIINSED